MSPDNVLAFFLFLTILFRPDDVLDNGNFLGLFRQGVGNGATRVAVTTKDVCTI
jgi:hypothetical protein